MMWGHLVTAFMLIVVTAGCSSSSTSSDATDVDAQHEDSIGDVDIDIPLLEPDADLPVDTVLEPDADISDPATDPVGEYLPDPRGDPHDCIDRTDSGSCSVINDTECGSSAFCDYGIIAHPGEPCRFTEMCDGGTWDHTPVEAACDPTHGSYSCDREAKCFPIIPGTVRPATCQEWCCEDTDCSVPGRTCSVEHIMAIPLEEDFCSGQVLIEPAHLCSQPCPVDEGCDPFDHTSCDPGDTCAWDADCNVLLCASSGIGDREDYCLGDGCRPGLLCHALRWDQPVRCYEFCDSTHPCDVGGCLLMGYGPRPDLGLCI